MILVARKEVYYLKQCDFCFRKEDKDKIVLIADGEYKGDRWEVWACRYCRANFTKQRKRRLT